MSTFERSITVPVSPPAPIGNYGGFYLVITPNYSAADVLRLDGSALLDGSSSTGGATAPQTYGPYSYTDFPTGVTVMIPEPSEHPLTYQCVVQPYSVTGTILPLASSPSATFTLSLPNRKLLSGTAYTRNAGGLTPQAATQRTTGGGGAGTGTSYTYLPVTWTIPANTPSYQGTIFVVTDYVGNIWFESQPFLGTSATLVFPTPTAVGTYTVYACGFDGTNVNPVVPGITPSFTITIGTAGGVVDPTQIPVGSGVSNTGPIALKYGAALGDDGSGNATILLAPASPFTTVQGLAISIAGPLYVDISNNLNLGISPDFVVTTVAGVPTLSQQAVNLAVAYGFNTTNFTIATGSAWVSGASYSIGDVVSYGATNYTSLINSNVGNVPPTSPGDWQLNLLAINSIAVNSLIAGTALFTGTATFGYQNGSTYGGKLQIGAAGLTIADNYNVPVNTLTLASTGASIANATSGASVVLSASGWAAFNAAGGSSSTGPSLIGSGTGITIYQVNGSTVDPYLNLTSTGIGVNSGGNMLLTVSSTGVSVQFDDPSLTAWTAGTYTYGQTVKLGGQNYIVVVASTTATPGSSADWSLINVLDVTAAGIGIYGPTCSLTMTSGGVAITSGSTGASISLSPGSGVIVQDASGLHYVQINSGGVTIVGGILTAPAITGGSLSITTSGSYGTATLSSTSTGLQFASGVFSSDYSAFDINLNNSSTGGAFQVGGAGTAYALSMTSGGGAQAAFTYDAINHKYSVLVSSNSGVTSTLTTTSLSISGQQVAIQRQSGPGSPGTFANLAAANTWCNNLYIALSASGGGHGLIN